MADVPLRPEAAPRWMRPMVDGVADLGRTAHARSLLSRRVPQRHAPDEAAVLMVFTGDDSARAGVLLTHRTPRMRSHSGQMAFPGGRIDPGDRGPVDAALREAWEETALDRSRVSPLVALSSLTTGGSRRVVRPVLAFSSDPGSPYAASPAETDDVFFAPVAHLVDPANRVDVGMLGWSGPGFYVAGYLVWGFTAVLLDVCFDAAGLTRPYDNEVVPLRRALEGTRNGERHPER